MSESPLSKSSRRQYKFIGEYLVEAGLLTETQLGIALADQRQSSMLLGEIVATRGWVKPKTIEYFVEKIIEPERWALNRSPSSSRVPPVRSKRKLRPAETNGVDWVG
ncbi:MAG: hypothetical protein AAGB01_02225 [Cyanobacteria bacterium P01_F01_bin.42]